MTPTTFASPEATSRDSEVQRHLRVVMIDEELPYPPTSGKRIRTLNLVQRLAHRHQLTYVCHPNADPDELAVATEHFRDLGIRTILVKRQPPPRSGPSFYGRLAANLWSPLPYSVASHASPQMTKVLQHLQQEEAIDLWHCEWTPFAEVVRKLPGRRVVMAHNVESVIWQRYHETESNPLKRWYMGHQWRKYQRFEGNILQKAQLTIAVSHTDATRFRNEFAIRRVAIVDNGVDTHYFTPAATPRDPASLLFLGSLDWRPNLDGIDQLLEQVYPSVKAYHPDTKLMIVGRNPPPSLLRKVATIPDVQVHGSVPDVRPFLHRASMLVVPLRIGGGSRLKILEALACSTPVVSTRIGAEGLHLVPGLHYEMAEDIATMAVSIAKGLNDGDRMARQAIAGRAVVLREYDWDVLANRLEQLWIQCAASDEDRSDCQGEQRE